ncbi:MAG: ATP-binding cassette domain-containing protein [Candidatus Aminicenantes bacterium]|nr:ATP-binding cassette domain-containing protein [Candidatus Aminicenantes bacterium]
MNEPLIQASHVAKRYRVLKRQRSTLRALKALWGPEKLTMEVWALRDLSFTIKRGEKVAVIGRNGSGKTTLLRLISGIIDPSRGSIEVAAEPLALFKFWIGQNADLPVIDNIYLFGAVCGMKRRQTEPLVAKILDSADIKKLGFAPLHDLSLGQRQRLALSIVFQAPADFLVFDETFVHVDQAFIRECNAFFVRLAESTRTMVITSHDHDFLKKYCQRALWLDKGQIRLDGPAAEVIAAYEAEK